MTYRLDWFEKWADYSPEKVAVKESESGRTLTYRQLNDLGNRVAGEWKTEGLLHGDRLVILAENTVDYFTLFSAAEKSGVILVPLNYRLSARELDDLLADCTPKAMLYEEKFRQVLDKTSRFSSIEMKETIEAFGSRLDLVKTEKSTPVSCPELSEDDPLFILYTSGTTGTPKGSLYTYKMLTWNSFNTTMRLDITSSDRSVTCMPLFHTGGWNVIPTPFLHRGAYICLTRKFDPEQILKLLQEEEATMFVAVPTMLQLMANSPAFSSARLFSMKYFIIGGEPMPLPLIKKWHQKGVPVRQGYGLTEAGPSVTSLHQDDAIRKMGSIGKINFYLDYRIVDEGGNQVKPGEVGEFLLRGPSVTPGYWKNDEATKLTFTGDWFHTGDLVKTDEEGFIFVIDRKKNMYISGGENVYPGEIEKFLYTHDSVKEVAVIGVPDEKWGEAGKAFIVLKEGFSLSENQLLDFCQGNLAKYKIPKSVQFLPELPKSDTGKINKKKLLELHQSQIK